MAHTTKKARTQTTLTADLRVVCASDKPAAPAAAAPRKAPAPKTAAPKAAHGATLRSDTDFVDAAQLAREALPPAPLPAPACAPTTTAQPALATHAQDAADSRARTHQHSGSGARGTGKENSNAEPAAPAPTTLLGRATCALKAQRRQQQQLEQQLQQQQLQQQQQGQQLQQAKQQLVHLQQQLQRQPQGPPAAAPAPAPPPPPSEAAECGLVFQQSGRPVPDTPRRVLKPQCGPRCRTCALEEHFDQLSADRKTEARDQMLQDLRFYFRQEFCVQDLIPAGSSQESSSQDVQESSSPESSSQDVGYEGGGCSSCCDQGRALHATDCEKGLTFTNEHARLWRERSAELATDMGVYNLHTFKDVHGDQVITATELHCMLFRTRVAHYIAGSDTPLKGVFERTDLRDKGGNLKTPAARVLLGSLGWTSGSMSDRVAYSNASPSLCAPERKRTLCAPW